MSYRFPTYGCYFCRCELPELEDDDAAIDVLIIPEWACYAEGLLNFNVLSELESVCAACAELLAGPDWFEKGRTAIARNERFEAAVRHIHGLRRTDLIQ